MRERLQTLLLGKPQWGTNTRVIRWKRSVLIGALCAPMVICLGYGSHVANQETTVVYLPDVGPDGTIFVPGDRKYSYAHLRWQFERCLVMRREHLQTESK
jgi:hypothetical protein